VLEGGLVSRGFGPPPVQGNHWSRLQQLTCNLITCHQAPALADEGHETIFHPVTRGKGGNRVRAAHPGPFLSITCNLHLTKVSMVVSLLQQQSRNDLFISNEKEKEFTGCLALGAPGEARSRAAPRPGGQVSLINKVNQATLISECDEPADQAGRRGPGPALPGNADRFYTTIKSEVLGGKGAPNFYPPASCVSHVHFQ
jgi:hypothetical protein